MKFALNLVSLPYLMVIENAAKAIGAIRGSRNAEHKIKDRIEYLKHENEKRDKAVEGHYEKKLGYFGVDPNVCHDANVKAQKEIDYLKSQL